MGAEHRAFSGETRALSDRQIAGCFNRSVGRAHRTRLIGGGAEPLYLPNPAGWSLIRYTRDYPASALHELAHWCIAGIERRTRLDYGYWYRPPPRLPAEQASFARVEVAAQALELHFARASGLRFQISMDDPDGSGVVADWFAEAVSARAGELAAGGLPARARWLVRRLEQCRASL